MKSMIDPSPNHHHLAPGLTIPGSILHFRFTRSSGPGGQNVNKLNTKAVLTIDLADLALHLPTGVFHRIQRLAGRYLIDDHLHIESAEHRSQIANRNECIDKLRHLTLRAQHPPKKRKPTRPTKSSKERRLTHKKRRSDIKSHRSRPHES